LPFTIFNPILRKIGVSSYYFPEDIGIRSWARLFLFVIGVKVEVEGGGSDPTVMVSNHLSALDSFIISSKCPGLSPRYIMKKEMLYFCPPLFVLAKLFGSTTIDRKNSSDSIARLNEAGSSLLSKRRSLVVFPEGTRTRTSKMMPFKKGAFHIASISKTTITPIVLNGCWHLWPPGSLLPAPGVVKLSYLKPISSDGKSPDELLYQTRKVIAEYMDNDKFRVYDNGYFLGTLPSFIFLILFYFLVTYLFF